MAAAAPAVPASAGAGAGTVTPDVPFRVQLVVVRHGQTDWNILGKLQGSDVDTHLNAFGVAQSARTGHVLASAVRHAHLLYCSTLTRARQTMAELMHAAYPETSWPNGDLTHARLHDARVTYDRRLLEQAMGTLSGQTKPERDVYIAVHKAAYDEYVKRQKAGALKPDDKVVHSDPFLDVPGAETIPHLEARVTEWLHDVVSSARAYAQKHFHQPPQAGAGAAAAATLQPVKPTVRVVAVAHGMLIKHLLLCALGPRNGDHAHARGDMIGKNEENCHLTVRQYDTEHYHAVTLPAAADVKFDGHASGMHWSQLYRSSNLHLSLHAAETKRAAQQTTAAADGAAVSATGAANGANGAGPHHPPVVTAADVQAATARALRAVMDLYDALDRGAPDLPPTLQCVAVAAGVATAAAAAPKAH